MGLGKNTIAFFEKLQRDMEAAPPPPIENIPIDELRSGCATAFAEYAGPLPDGVAPQDFTPSQLPLKNDLNVPVITYTPNSFRKKEDDTAIFFHGGGFVTNLLNAHMPGIATMANQANCKVIAIDYPLAPEFKAKQVTEICYEAVNYLFEHSEELDLNSSKITIVGYSSGANLVAGIVNRSRLDSIINFKQQILMSPWLDLSFSIHKDNPFLSYQEQDQMQTTEALEYFTTLYIGTESPKAPHISPVFEPDLSDLPPTTIIMPEYDRLRGTAEFYAERLKDAGVSVKRIVCDGQTHNFFICRAVMDDGVNPAEEIAQAIHQVPDSSVDS